MGHGYSRVIKETASSHVCRVSLDNVSAVLKETRCFEHLTDSHIFGFIMDKYGPEKSKDRYFPARTYNKTCGKCKGKGWFGRGRKPCPECGGDKAVTVHEAARWKTSRRANWLGQSSKRASVSWWSGRFNNGCFDRHGWARHIDPLLSNGIPYLVNKALRAEEEIVPDAVIKLRKLKGCEQTKAEIEQFIMQHARTSVRNPRVSDVYNLELIYRAIDERMPWVDIDVLCQRLAKSFGVTCPITGEWVNPKNLENNSNEKRHYWIDARLPGRLGLPWVYLPYNSDCFVSAVTPEMRRQINAAYSKWWSNHKGSPNETWLLAELIEKTIPKMRVAA